MAFTLAQILDFLASDVIDQGDANTRQNLQKQISKIASLDDATDTDITFIANHGRWRCASPRILAGKMPKP